ncbi:Small subunit processome component 20-like protein, partial [Stegodyphus mimosarum]
MKSVADIISSVMISGCVNFPVDKINLILTQIYSQSEEIFFHFTRNMFKYGMFEKDLLPLLLSSCMKLMSSDDARKKKSILQILSETVTSLKPILTSESDIKSFTKLYLYAPAKNSMGKKCLSSASACTVLEKFLIETLCFDELTRSNLPEIWAALVCLPHIRFLNIEYVSKVLQELAVKIHKYLLSTQFTKLDHAEEWSFTLCQAYFVFLVITADYEKENCFNTKFFIDLLKKHSRSLGVLRMVDLHLRSYKKLPSLEELGTTCEELTLHVIPNLASPYHLERLLTLQILNALELSPKQSEDRSESVLNICIEAERIPLDVQSYREKVKWLRKLEYQFVEKNIPIIYDTFLKKVPVYYLLGNLYINFKLLWDPSISVLETYAHGTTEIFWNVLAEHLSKITELCETGENADSSLETENESESYSAFYRSLFQFCKRDENPDVINHRLLLWKAMSQFSDVVEPKNKTVVPFLFRFMTNEVVKVDTSMAATESVNKTQWDGDMSDTVMKEKCIESETAFQKRKRRLKQETPQKSKKLKSEREKGLLNDTLDNDESVDMIDVNNEEGESNSDGNEESEVESEEEEEIVQVPQTKMTKTSAKRKRHVAKTLAALLSVFAKFKNPKAIYKTEELQKLYNELLSYHDPDIQRLSFDCLMTYNYNYLIPYKDNFYRILDNKTFKSEVVLFSLDTENHVIQEQHRINVLPVLMRIMYGKMLHKTGNNTTGKSQAQTRRSLVLRFLAGCKAEELKMFFDLVFLPFKEQLSDDTLTAVKKVRESIDLSNVVPIRRQHSALNTLGLILQHLGNLIPELLYWLLKVLLIITATSVTLLEKREEVLPQCVTLLKAVRTQAVMKLMQFFKSFPQYDFKPDEIDAVFESIVWPILPRLEHESINQPSPLLRLLATWSEKPRYFVLFAKHHENSASLTPLPHLMDLYSCPRAKSRVVGVISKIIFQLLTIENETSEEEEKLPPLEINCHLSLLGVIIDGVPAAFGTKLLLPFVDKILSRIEMTVSVVTKKKVKKSISTRDLTILLRISKYVNDSAQCSK